MINYFLINLIYQFCEIKLHKKYFSLKYEYSIKKIL